MENKRALVLSGGGSKGAFELGALQYLIEDLNRDYDLICGVSTGALNAGYLAQYNDLQNAMIGLEKLWLHINQKDIYKRWFPFGLLHALWKSSAYNSKPIEKLIKNNIDILKVQNSNKQLCVGAVSLTNGNYRIFTDQDSSIISGILASSAFPGGLKPQFIEGEWYFDGGIRNNIPINSAIKAGATEIDIIIPSMTMKNREPYDGPMKTIPITLYSIDLMIDEIESNDLKTAQLYNELVMAGKRPDKRFIKFNIIRPSIKLTNNSFGFNHDNIRKMIAQGYADAKVQFKV